MRTKETWEDIKFKDIQEGHIVRGFSEDYGCVFDCKVKTKFTHSFLSTDGDTYCNCNRKWQRLMVHLTIKPLKYDPYDNMPEFLKDAVDQYIKKNNKREEVNMNNRIEYEGENKMHKDWDGPGWYHRWASECYCGAREYTKEQKIGAFGGFDRYEKFTPPKPPKKELPDGLYYGTVKPFSTVAALEPIIMGKRKGQWRNMATGEHIGGPEENGNFTILGRIPVEPVEE